MTTAHVLEIERLNRLYAGLSYINQAIVRMRTRDELFRRVCEVLVEQGGFPMAWIGWRHPESGRLVPVAHAGDENGYLQCVEVSADDRAECRGPWSQAFRENRPYICNDLLEDPATLPWRAELERRGFAAFAVFPIQTNDIVGGTLSVYADRIGFLRDREVALLAEAATDISFGLDNLAREEARKRADEIVKRFVAIVESTDDAIIGKTLDGVITSWNHAAESMFGYSAEEIVGRSIELLIPADRPQEEQMILGRIRRGERIMQFETIREKKDGTRFPVSITISPIWGSREVATAPPEIVGVSKIVRDITERKRADAIVESEQRFAKSLIEAMPGIFYIYDEHGKFLRWNRNFESVSGYSADEIAKMHPLDFFSSDEKPLLQQRIAEVFATGEGTVEATLVSKDGSATPHFFTGKRMVLDGALRLVGVGVNIAERKRAEDAAKKAEERYRSTLDNILEGCQLLGFDWHYLYLNPAAAIQNRRPNSELLGFRMPDAWPGIEALTHERVVRQTPRSRTNPPSARRIILSGHRAGEAELVSLPLARLARGGDTVLSSCCATFRSDSSEGRRVFSFCPLNRTPLGSRHAYRVAALDIVKQRGKIRESAA